MLPMTGTHFVFSPTTSFLPSGTTRLFVIATVFIAFLTLGLASADAQLRTRDTTAGDETPTIFDVRKSLPMEPNEASYHDFYINAGSEAGFKKGQYLPVQRAIPVHDPVQNKQQAILTIPVGKIVVIHSERNITVARLVTELGDDERPTLEYEAIMIGDRIDMKGISMEAPKEAGKKKKKTAAVEAPISATVTAVVSQPAAAEPAPSVANASSPSAAPVSSAVENAVKSSGNGAGNGAAPSEGAKPDVGQQPSAAPRITQPVPPPPKA